MAEYLMGIDAGTGSVRVALFDFRGQNRAYAVAEYGTTYPKNGWAEQSDYEWFEALKKAIPECIKKAGIAADNIAAITCDATTNTLVYLDENDTSVRPPILWMFVQQKKHLSLILSVKSMMQLSSTNQVSVQTLWFQSVCGLRRMSLKTGQKLRQSWNLKTG